MFPRHPQAFSSFDSPRMRNSFRFPHPRFSNDTLFTYCDRFLPWSLRLPRARLIGTCFFPGMHQRCRHEHRKRAPFHTAISEYSRATHRALSDEKRNLYCTSPSLPELATLIEQWFSFGPEDFKSLTADSTTLTRVLSILEEISHISPQSKSLLVKYNYDRAVTGFTPIPGGNLTTLLWIAFRFCIQFARSLPRIPEEIQSVDHMNQFIRDGWKAISLVGGCPAHWFVKECGPRKTGTSPYLWGTRSVGRVARAAIARVKRGVENSRVASPHIGRSRRYSMRALPRKKFSLCTLSMSREDVLIHNFNTYRQSATDILVGVATLLRIIGHTKYRLHRLLQPDSSSFRQINLDNFPRPKTVQQLARQWNDIVEPLQLVARTPDDLLNEHFFVSYRDAGVPLMWYYIRESELEVVWDTHLTYALYRVWGVGPGAPDSLRRAGQYGPVDDEWHAYEVLAKMLGESR